MKNDVLELLENFVEDQKSLCREIALVYKIEDDDSFFFRAPKFGAVRISGESWNFQKHGVGMRFTNTLDGRIVDPHKHFVSRPEAFDAWRIFQFLESLNISDIEFDGVSYLLDNDGGVQTLLASLENTGLIRSIDGEHALYQFDHTDSP